VSAAGGEEALGKLDGIDCVVTDVAMPGLSGLELLAAIRERDARLPVVVLTAHGNERVAVQAMKAGAWDYLAKPFSNDELRLVLARAVETRRLRSAARDLRLATLTGGARPVGAAPAFRRALQAAERVADRDIPVLVRGETGTGKELFAALIHAASRRAAGPFVRFNCAAIPPELADAELFGHTRGAFTGAVAARAGFFAQADGGTLVLDEVGELPAAVQPKLLRALQGGEIQAVGAGRVDRVDVRVIACTHRDLRAEVAAGRLREDLYYRLNVVEIVVPSLAERREDIPALVEHFRRGWAARFGEEATFSDELVGALAARDYPGNIRELENAVARLVAMSAGGEIGVAALGPAAAGAPAATFAEQVAAFERSLLAAALEAAGWNQSEAARRLGMSRVTLIDKMKRYGVKRS
jgi:two-component system response regulator AtoC